VRTRRIAVSFALFNVLVLVSRTSNSFQGLLAKRIEATLTNAGQNHLLTDFRWLLLSATVATIAGTITIPTFQRVFGRAVRHFQANRSIPKLLLRGFAKGGLTSIKDAVTLPSAAHLKEMRLEKALRSPANNQSILISRTFAQARSMFAVAIAEKPGGRFMIRSRTRVVQRHPASKSTN
jgi:hypothetical protein